MAQSFRRNLNRLLQFMLPLLLAACGTVAVQTDPKALKIPEGAAADLRAPQMVSLRNAYQAETVVKVNNATPAWTSDLKLVTDTAIAILTQAIEKQGLKVVPQAEKFVTVRVHSVSAGLAGLMIAPEARARIVLDATYPDGSRTTVDAHDKALYHSHNVIDGAVMLAAMDLLRHPEFVSYMNR